MGRNGTKGRGTWIAALCASLLTLTLTTTPAQAQQAHLFKETFGSAQQPSFKGVVAIAIDQSSGDVLVLDSAEGKLSRFKPNGEADPFPALGTNVIDAKLGPGSKPCAEEPSSCDAAPGEFGGISGGNNEAQIAIDESGTATDGNIYVIEAETDVVDVFAADGHFLGQLTKFGTKNFGDTSGIAVDGAGNFYVSDFGRNAIHKYVPTANPPKATDFTTDFTTIARPQALAMGAGPTAGSLFVVRRTGSAASFSGGLFKLKLSNGELQYALVDGLVNPPSGAVGITTTAVDPGSGHVFAAYAGNSARVEEYDASGPSSATILSTTKVIATSLALHGASGDLYSAGPSGTKVVLYGAPISTLPDVLTGEEATGVTPSKATVHGTVNPDGQAVTECAFEYTPGFGLPPDSYDHVIPCAQSPAEIGSGASPVQVEASLSGLAANGTGNHVRLVAKNANETPVFGSNLNFHTIHTAITQPASAIGGTTATLNGTVHPDGTSVTACLFEYGTTPSYGSTVPCAESEAEIGSGESPVPVHADVSGLTSNTPYHFRLAATTGNGEDKGEDEGFGTLDESGVQTTAATKVGGAVATLNGTVDPGGVAVGECLFQYVDEAGYEPLALDPYADGETVPCAESEAEIGSGGSSVAVHADVSGLQPKTTYHFRLVAGPTGAAIEGGDEQFVTLGPRVEDAWATSVADTEAMLKAEVDANGSAVAMKLEWGLDGVPYEHTEPIGGLVAQVATARLGDLTAGAAHHYRFVATSQCNPLEAAEVCIATGPERAFVTYRVPVADADCPNQAYRSGASAVLPDCRAYEMVSPVDKEGGDIFALPTSRTIVLGAPEQQSRLDQATPDGEALTYSTSRASGHAESAPWAAQYLTQRDPQAGWIVEAISPPRRPNSFYRDAGQEVPFKGFTEDLCSGWVLEDSGYPLAPGAPEHVPNAYRRDNCGGSGYELLTSMAPPGYSAESELGDIRYFPYPQGYSADGSRTVLRANAALTPDACPTKGIYQLYASSPGGSCGW